MRPRLVVLASVMTTLLAVAVPSVAAAAPTQSHSLTINVTPNPILAGEGVLIYGQSKVSPVAGQTIILYHHIASSPFGYTKVAQTQTDSHGFYWFTRAENVVQTNRSWFVRSTGAPATDSRTVFERVSAIVTLGAAATNAATNQPVTFAGTVAPSHRGELVRLQQQFGSSTDWQTVDSAHLGPGSRYSITHRFRLAGVRSIRVLFPGDSANIRGASDPVTLTIQQKQLPDFTIATSSPLITYGETQPVTISGVLHQPGSAKPEVGTPVTLWAQSAGQSQFIPVADTTTSAPDGSYTFTPPTPTSNTVYQVRTTLAPNRHSARLFEGVRDAVSLIETPSPASPTVGSTITLTGTVFPDKTGQPVYLQRVGPDGAWHNVASTLIQSGSKFTFGWTFGKAGQYQFRARITDGEGNISGASAPVSIQVAPAGSPAALPPAS